MIGVRDLPIAFALAFAAITALPASTATSPLSEVVTSQPTLPEGVRTWTFSPYGDGAWMRAAFSPRGNAFCLSESGLLWSFDVRTGRLQPSGNAHTFTSSVMSSTGTMFLGITTPQSAEIAPTQILIDAATGRSRGDWKGPLPSAPYSAQGRQRPGQGEIMAVTLVDIAPDGSAFAAAYAELPRNSTRFLATLRARLPEGAKMPVTIDRVAIGDPRSGAVQRVLESPLTDRTIGPRDFEKTDTTDSLGIGWLAFSPDGAKLAAYVRTGTIIVWDVSRGTVLAVLDTGASRRHAFVPAFTWLADNDTMYAYPSHDAVVKAGERLMIRASVAAAQVTPVRWTVPSVASPPGPGGLPAHERPLDASQGQAHQPQVTVSPDGRYALSGASSRREGGRIVGGLGVVDLESTQLIGIVPLSYAPLTAFSSDSQQVAIVARSGTVLLMSTETLLSMARDETALPEVTPQPVLRKPPPPQTNRRGRGLSD